MRIRLTAVHLSLLPALAWVSTAFAFPASTTEARWPEVRYNGVPVTDVKWRVACAKGGAPAVVLAQPRGQRGFLLFLCEGQGAIDPKRPLECDRRLPSSRSEPLRLEAAYASLDRSAGLLLYRDGRADLNINGESYQELRCTTYRSGS